MILNQNCLSSDTYRYHFKPQGHELCNLSAPPQKAIISVSNHLQWPIGASQSFLRFHTQAWDEIPCNRECLGLDFWNATSLTHSVPTYACTRARMSGQGQDRGRVSGCDPGWQPACEASWLEQRQEVRIPEQRALLLPDVPPGTQFSKSFSHVSPGDESLGWSLALRACLATPLTARPDQSSAVPSREMACVLRYLHTGPAPAALATRRDTRQGRLHATGSSSGTQPAHGSVAANSSHVPE